MKEKIIRAFYIFLYKVSYEIIYANFSSKIFSYSGLIWDPVLWKCILSYIILLLLLLLPERKNTITKYLMNIYFVFTIIPILSFYWQANKSTYYVLMCSTTYLIMHMGCYLKNEKKAKKIVLIKFLYKINISKFLIIFTLFVLFLLMFKYGIADLRAMNLADVYLIRSERKFFGFWGYIINWLPYSIIPCILCISLYRKDRFQIIIAILFQIYLFLFMGTKTTLFSIGLIMFSYYITSKNMNFINSWALFLSGINIATTYIYIKFNQLMIFTIFPIRLLTIPAYVSNIHYDFFSNNKKLIFSENFIGRFLGFESPYDTFSTFLVSKGSSNANTGLLGDAYDNGGFLVMILYAFFFIIIFRYIERIYNTSKNDLKASSVFVGILTYSMIYLNDGTLTALLITGGLIINIMILMHFSEWSFKWK